MTSLSKQDIENVIRRLILQVRAESVTVRVKTELYKIDYLLGKAGYRPDQPRDFAGTPTGGQWTTGLSSAANQVVAAAKRIRVAAFSQKYSLCVDLCYPLLERPQGPGLDFNLWDFQKCLNRCLGRNL